MGSEKDIVNKSGAWYSYEGERIGQGRENAKKYFMENPELRVEIEQKVRAAYGIGEEVVEEEKTEPVKNEKKAVEKKVSEAESIAVDKIAKENENQTEIVLDLPEIDPEK